MKKYIFTLLCFVLLFHRTYGGVEMELILSVEDLSKIPERINERMRSEKNIIKDPRFENGNDIVRVMMNEKKATFIKSKLSLAEIKGLLAQEVRLGELSRKLGYPVGKRSTYIGSLLRKSWNLVVEQDKKVIFLNVTAYFLPSTEEGISSFTIQGYSIISSENMPIPQD